MKQKNIIDLNPGEKRDTQEKRIKLLIIESTNKREKKGEDYEERYKQIR